MCEQCVLSLNTGNIFWYTNIIMTTGDTDFPKNTILVIHSFWGYSSWQQEVMKHWIKETRISFHVLLSCSSGHQILIAFPGLYHSLPTCSLWHLHIWPGLFVLSHYHKLRLSPFSTTLWITNGAIILPLVVWLFRENVYF